MSGEEVSLPGLWSIQSESLSFGDWSCRNLLGSVTACGALALPVVRADRGLTVSDNLPRHGVRGVRGPGVLTFICIPCLVPLTPSHDAKSSQPSGPDTDIIPTCSQGAAGFPKRCTRSTFCCCAVDKYAGSSVSRTAALSARQPTTGWL